MIGGRIAAYDALRERAFGAEAVFGEQIRGCLFPAEILRGVHWSFTLLSGRTGNDQANYTTVFVLSGFYLVLPRAIASRFSIKILVLLYFVSSASGDEEPMKSRRLAPQASDADEAFRL
jgi:hypothetical protein